LATVSGIRRQWAVCVYCASGPVDPELLALATNVGESIADRGWTLVSGGGNVSAMGALATGARAHNGHTVGVIPKALVHREVADVHAGELIITDTMRERKQVMEERADAFLALPGGIGTLEELFETWTAGYLGMHDKPVVMLDPHGHYDGLLEWLVGLLDRGYVHPMALARLVVTRRLEDALDACAPSE
jgi:uncharacterized protein (TIGR00730 family)